jgi:hypothetical protein
VVPRLVDDRLSPREGRVATAHPSSARNGRFRDLLKTTPLAVFVSLTSLATAHPSSARNGRFRDLLGRLRLRSS